MMALLLLILCSPLTGRCDAYVIDRAPVAECNARADQIEQAFFPFDRRYWTVECEVDTIELRDGSKIAATPQR